MHSQKNNFRLMFNKLKYMSEASGDGKTPILFICLKRFLIAFYNPTLYLDASCGQVTCKIAYKALACPFAHA